MAMIALTFFDFFHTNGCIPQGHSDPLVWLHVTSELCTAIAYYFVLIILLYFFHKRQDIHFPKVFFLFSAFILFSGTTHLFGIITFWYPIYWISGVIKISTIIVSVATIFALVKSIPNALKLKSPTKLAKINVFLNQQVKDRQLAELALQKLNDNLEKIVQERIAETSKINQQLIQEIEERKKDQEKLRQNKNQLAQLAAIVTSSQDAIISTNLERIVTSWNNSAENLFGYAASEVLGKNIRHIIPSDLFMEEELICQCIYRGKQIDTYETVRQRKDGTKVDLALTISPIRDEHGNVVGTSEIARDITVRLEAEKQLRESQHFIEKIANNSPQILYILDPINWHNFYINEQSFRLLGYDPEEFVNGGLEFLQQVIHPDDLPTLYKNRDFWKTAMDDEMLTTEYRLKHKNGLWQWFCCREIIFSRDEASQSIKVLGTAQDISDSKEQERQIYGQSRRELLLREITQRIRQSLDLPTIFETVVQEIRKFLEADRVAILQFDSESNFEIGNIVAESVLEPFDSTLAGTIQEHCFSNNYAQKYQQGRIQIVEDIYQSNLQPCYVEFLASLQVRANLVLPLVNDSVLWGLLCIHQCTAARAWETTEIDLLKQITNQFEIAIQQAILYEQVQQELAFKNELFCQLTNELDQKKILLKEIHHRVKNNLQIMSSLLYLQFNKTSPAIQQLSEECQNRIQSMALVHEQLYRSDDLTNIDFSQYLKNLTNNVYESYDLSNGAIKIKLLVDQIKVPLEQSIPLGLIIQELVSNSLKHAFPQSKGEIIVKFIHLDNSYSLMVQDNGIGIPAGIDLENTDSLGMQLTHSLTEQLQGELTYAYIDGSQFTLNFTI